MSINVKGYAVPTDQVVYIGNCASLATLHGKFYILSYALLYDYVNISVICGERYIRMKYNKCEMLMHLPRVHANKAQEFIEKWTK